MKKLPGQREDLEGVWKISRWEEKGIFEKLSEYQGSGKTAGKKEVRGEDHTQLFSPC